ncbi:hypothetical protein [Desulfosarcina cetonica]|uniref:hypothetical protein n=1 Tax=Desulfosarcina cetonica TaxID=90730 RepID=UPI0006CF77FF|nr:hypothetical protein [Desulfosarcina cetonica]
MAEDLNVVGQRLIPKENLDKATGRAEYCTTVSLPGMLVGKILRSPHAHAKVLSVNTSEAKKIPGVKAVVTGTDFPRVFYSNNVMTYQCAEGEPQDMILFGDVVRYVGEPVAAVAAVNEEVARMALAAIDVSYDVLPAVFTIDETLKDGAPQIHEGVPNNTPVPPTPYFLLWRHRSKYRRIRCDRFGGVPT